MADILGVNLGNWLVLERWMNPPFFEGIDPDHWDETHFCLFHPDDKQELLRQHRDTFITKQDFQWIRDAGLNSVRIPVPHWIYGDVPPYVGCIEYLDQAMEWAQETELSVLIDLHCAPGCQNGFDNGGILGVCDWHKDAKNIDRTIGVLEKLSERYAAHPALWGVQLLNEPSWDVPMDILRDFYIRAYAACRKHLGADKAIVIHDRFEPKAWHDFMTDEAYENVVLDTHMYQCFTDEPDALKPYEHVLEALNRRLQDLTEISRTHRVIVGEWSLGLPESKALAAMDARERLLVRKAYADAQLLTQENCLGWYFWSYKLKNEEAVDWDYKRLREAEILPDWRA